MEPQLAGSVHTEAYKYLLKQLVVARGNTGLSQAQLAERLSKPASFVGKYELGERRLDVIELLVVLKSLEVDSAVFFENLLRYAPDRL